MIEEFLAVGEKLFGPYVWGRYGQRAWFPRAGAGAPELVLTEPPAPPGRYDILFMPPSFPFGGMENPCLTFLTPCVLAGDRSLADVVIHEISHSWFGNLVTNATWGEFWLNEGFTMYAQRRISTEVYGAWPGRACGPGVCAAAQRVPPSAAGGRSLRCISAEVKSSSCNAPGVSRWQQNRLCSEMAGAPAALCWGHGRCGLAQRHCPPAPTAPWGGDTSHPELSRHTVTSVQAFLVPFAALS